MKRIVFPVLALLTLLIASCSEDFSTAAPYKTVTFIYGMLDMGDTAHYIRIEKAFLDQTQSALVLAKNPDSVFIPNLDVKVKVINGGILVNTITLSKVDLNNEGYPKDTSGQFFSSPNYAYKFKDALNPQYTYRLVVYNPNTGETDSAESPVISNDPNDFSIPYFQNTSSMIDIAQTTLSNNFNKVAGSVPPGAAMFEGIIRFHWKDKNNASGTETDQSADWNFANTNQASGIFQLTVSNLQFYSGIRNSLGTAPTGYGRELGNCDIIVWAGSQELYNYQVITSTQANSLTSDEVKPNYTNIKGKNVLGLFASRTMIKDLSVPFTQASLDSIRNNSITVPCNILP